MNVNLAFLGLSTYCVAFLVGSVGAEPKLLLISAPPPAYKPWIASEKDVVGDWMDGGTKYWEVMFESNHTLEAYQGDYVATGPYISTWKLVNNHVIITDSPALRKRGFDTD